MSDTQNDPLESLGPTIQRLRKAAGYSLNALSEESGVAKSMLSRIENNESNPTLNTMWKISQALNMNVDELLRERESRPAIIAHQRPASLPLLISEDGLCELRITGAIETVSWLQSYELRARPGGILDSAPHPEGTVESLYVRKGCALVSVGGVTQEVSTGELIRYRGDLPHRIIAAGEETLRATMINERR